jgi:hypothetical protein
METYLFLYIDIINNSRFWFATEATTRLAAVINFLDYLDVGYNDCIDNPDKIIKAFNVWSKKFQITNIVTVKNGWNYYGLIDGE